MRHLTTLMLGLLFIGSAYSEQNDRQKALVNEAKLKINILATELKGALVSSIQEGGLHHAVKVCEQQAPKIAKRLSNDGWSVARTSLKTRNQNNNPDVWEAAVLLDFDNRFKAGETLERLSVSKLDDIEFRYMKAIPTDQVCLACHGSSVDPALLKSVNAQYPNDKATGFTLDDIRGAFTVTKQIEMALQTVNEK